MDFIPCKSADCEHCTPRTPEQMDPDSDAFEPPGSNCFEEWRWDEAADMAEREWYAKQAGGEDYEPAEPICWEEKRG